MNIDEINDLFKFYKERRKIILQPGIHVFPSMIYGKVITIEPMVIPSGLIFYLDYMCSKENKQKEE